MKSAEILNEAISLKSAERFMLVEEILKSLDEPDVGLDKIWINEAQKRLNSYRSGKEKGIPMEDIF
ncbi:MAG: addiction module protein [Candidatus Ruthia sp.]|jgi:putative addiction module component (TIGR02574 family)|nr:addiction module protein [Candidatus Ruthturnera sp.]